jgi:DNA invertase Pin-like site-specific DNA recombinase
VVRDNGSDESMALTRPGLAHALDQLRGGSAARLVVDRLERLGRSVTDLRPLIQWCASNDVDLVALEGGLDASVPEAEPALGVGNGHEDAPKARRRRWKRSERAWTRP